MKIVMDIPDEFLDEYFNDQFNDSLSRVRRSITRKLPLAGSYELGTLNMLVDSLHKSRTLKELLEKVNS